jgi:hypothetical protein
MQTTKIVGNRFNGQLAKIIELTANCQKIDDKRQN